MRDLRNGLELDDALWICTSDTCRRRLRRSSDGDQNDACMHHMRIPHTDLNVGGTQHMPLSAADVQAVSVSKHVVHSSITALHDGARAASSR